MSHATQKAKIIFYLLNHPTLTPMEAFRELHITKLATRIGELIADGWQIEKGWEEHTNADGETSRYRVYSLSDEAVLSLSDEAAPDSGKRAIFINNNYI